MRFISFNLFRTLGLPDVSYIKPEEYQKHPHRFQGQIDEADWLLFPEYWQLNGLEYGSSARIFPSPASYRIGHDKIEITRACQLLVPNNLPTTWITKNSPEEAERLWQLLDTPFVAKEAKSSQGVGVWLIENRQDWQHYLTQVDRLYVQEYLPIDRDLRIVVVGEEVIAAYWRLQSDRSFHTNVSRGGEVSYDAVPAVAIEFVLSLAKRLGVNHAGFDVAMVGDHPYLLEFNRLFGNQGIPGGGKAITEAILRYLSQQGDDDKPNSPNSPNNPNRPRRLPIAV
ncbi:hypothetical protein [Halioxenophilus sp. WMMB6]|uniref:ATP-grasp domain-containing protein n=1 Tax=Halioxenophilus sp. WMMB6 TaxID=3073815 RepID=UPI00295E40C2|nr:hypothetical protein [Halioxenophilus sp. WMMB6]